MDRVIVAGTLAAVLAFFVAGSYALFWALERTLDAVDHLRHHHP